ncbi:TetR/AcrR family transcriptional regulator [Cryptosporangium minutisporangium]|uniref:TetR/AcrR family transcriptional regulator n=1 Tax=Cryptosporangium minutisporangium TaxID=113569 RepID=A0ABP6SRH2_9ACTN
MSAMRADARRNREKILAAAAAVVAEQGHAASTEEVAARAGVAVGTVFRHFPTKKDLLAALLKDLSTQLMTQATTLADDPGGLFEFFTAVVERAAGQRTVVELLSAAGMDVDAGRSLEPLRDAVAVLTTRGQAAGLVRSDVDVDEVLAMLTLATHSVLQQHWDDALRRRTTALMLDGLRAAPV